LEYNTTYYWQIVAFNEAGSGTASVSRSFTTQIAPPGQVTVSSPANGATDQPVRPTLTWQQPTGTVTGYYVFRGTAANPYNSSNPATNRVATINDASTTSWTHTSDLAYGTTYHWQIVAFNVSGSGTASVSRSFTTVQSTYTITFNANNGTVTPSSGTTGTDGKLASLPTPTRTGYKFDGWFTAATGGTKVTTDTVFSEDTVIYARWIVTTSNPEMSSVNPLRAWMSNGLLHVEGLTEGEAWSVYSVSGVLVYSSIATGGEADIPLKAQGVYIVQSGENSVKISNF
jgi:uncharacterized repeat protein (TIGR02543 family)